MNLFTLLFPIFMLVMPLGFCMLFRPGLMRSQDEAARKRVRMLMTSLFICTGLSIGLLFAPRPISPFGASFTWMLFFPLWFGLAMPITAKSYPSLATAGHAPAGEPRAASLERREAHVVVPTRAWVLPWLLFIGLSAVAIVGLTLATPTIKPIVAIGVVGLQLVVGAMICVLGPIAVHMCMTEPEPMPADAPEELEKAYARHRSFKAHGFYYGAILMLLVVMGVACGFAWGVSGGVMGIGGAVVGTTVGIAGGVFGTIAGVRRAKINEQLAQLNAA